MNLSVKHILFFIIIHYLILNLHSQNRSIDSMINLVKSKPNDTVMVRTLADLSTAFGKIDQKQAELYANECFKTSQKTKNEKWKIISIATLAAIENDKGDFDKAEKYFMEALVISQKIKSVKTEASLGNNLAMLYQDQNKYDKAINLYLRCAELNKSGGNLKDLAKNYNNMGNTYRDQDKLQMALKYYLMSVDLREKLGDKAGLSSSFKNMAMAYEDLDMFKDALELDRKALAIDLELGNKKGVGTVYNNMGVGFRNRNQFDSALHYLELALKFREELNQKSPIARTLLNIGAVYSIQKKYAPAEKYLLKALPYTRESNDQGAIMMALAELSNVEGGKKNYPLAIDYCQQAIAQAWKIGQSNTAAEAYRSLASLYSESGDCKAAYNLFFRYSELMDSLGKTSQSQVISDMLEKYERATKDKELLIKEAEIKSQESDNKKKSVQRNAFIVGFILMLGLAFFIFKGYRQKQKANILITQQKQEVESQKHLLVEQKKEIIDSINYAKRIQQSILPSIPALAAAIENGFLLYKPKDIVAGDFYWMEKAYNKVYFAAADCTGHGVPGAMVSVVCSNALSKVLLDENNISTGRLLDLTREHVIEKFSKSGEDVKDGMDISLCSIDFSNLSMQWSGANNSFWLIRGNELIETKADKQPIGKYSDPKPFKTHRFQLIKGDTIYLFTDGYADQFGGPKGKKYKASQLKEKLISIQNQSMDEQKLCIEKEFENWQINHEQVDDVCVIGVKI